MSSQIISLLLPCWSWNNLHRQRPRKKNNLSHQDVIGITSIWRIASSVSSIMDIFSETSKNRWKGPKKSVEQTFEVLNGLIYLLCSFSRSIKAIRCCWSKCRIWGILLFSWKLVIAEWLDQSTLVRRVVGSKPHSDLSQSARKGFASSLKFQALYALHTNQ